MQFDSMKATIRVLAELTMLSGAFLYLVSAFLEARFLGLRMFFENLVSLITIKVFSELK